MSAHTGLDSIVQAIGNTPLVKLQKLSPPGRTLWVKCEHLNPGGSAKDRAVRSMVDALERSGELSAGCTVVEGTAGNTGIGLALVCAARGYPCVVVLPRTAAPDKQAVLRLLGARLVHTEPDLPLDDPQSYVSVARALAASTPQGVLLGQFDRPSNPAAHVDTTGPELWRQTGGVLDVLVGCVGTGGTLSGTSAFLRQHVPHLRVVAASPAQSPTCIEGITDDDPPEDFGGRPPEARHFIDDAEAIRTAQLAAQREGLLIGLSAGAALAAALRDAPSWPEGSTAVVIAPDTARNYMGLLAP